METPPTPTLRLLGKFTVGAFVSDRSGYLGVVHPRSTLDVLVIQWLQRGDLSKVRLKPHNKRGVRELQRMKRLKVLQLRDFRMRCGIPCRMVKVERWTRNGGGIDAIVQGILETKTSQLDRDLLVKEVQRQLQLPSQFTPEIKVRRTKNFLRILVRLHF